MKKTLIALAVAGLSMNAMAADLTASPVVNVPVYASEIVLPAALTEGADVLDTTTNVGFSINEGSTRFVRYDLTNAEFDTPVVFGDLALTTGGTAVLTVTVSAGGAAGDSFVLFEITPTGDDVAVNDTLTFNLADINATGGAASIQYRLYETGVAASQGNSDTLATTTGPLLTFDNAISFANASTLDTIDVVQLSRFFDDAEGDAVANLGNWSITESGAYATTGVAATVADVFSDLTLELEGDFSAGLKDGADLADNALVATGVAAADTTLTASSAEFTLGLVETSLLPVQEVVYTVDGETEIAEQEVAAVIRTTENAGYAAGDVTLGDFAFLNKNGSFDTVELALNPNGAYSHFIRISNTSNIDGIFTVTVTNDAGDVVTFPLSAIADQPAEIAARASTTQILMSEVYAAAALEGLELTGENKLRVRVDGQVPSMDLQSYTVATDNSTFSVW